MSKISNKKYDSFEEIKKLSTEALESLLAKGDATERVYATWALALKKGTIENSDILTLCDGEPNAGVRRHLIIILAGSGQLKSLYNLAENDPDPEVRADALQYLIRAGEKDEALANYLRNYMEHDSTPLIIMRILNETAQNFFPLSLEEILSFMESDHLDLQMMCLKQMSIRILFTNNNSEKIAQLLNRNNFDVSVLKGICSLLIDNEYEALIFKQALLQNTKPNLDLFQYLIDHRISFSWSVISQYVDPNDRNNAGSILKLLSDLQNPQAFAWLTNIYAKMLLYGSSNGDYMLVEQRFWEVILLMKFDDVSTFTNEENLVIIHEFIRNELDAYQGDIKPDYLLDYHPDEQNKIIEETEDKLKIIQVWISRE